MANTFNFPVWIIDTASGTPITTDWITLKSIRWVGGATNDVATIQDQASNVVWSSTATTPTYNENDLIENYRERPINGLKVTALPSGKLYLQLA